ncbi:MAG: Chain length determinant exopolysaccharide biosynthesis protein EpsF [uncultured Sphingomonas sp.]|uniref:Chain length determinant exopolysaccharide biosynthesis protein EpsF n=1 Tax=uncultured Sphingomonas sp. TaxID=158754 RepID=A0A6J4TWD2_9SPHN|nr:hypothetical protein [uncultured Sphingomonas sp.]CAA9534165.1 MAG: Chain length determinant exopolysaccharide biosynthesis protein EpsF [uncultured Sphingomonas sp.]
MHSFLDWLEAVRFRWKLVALSMGALALLALIYLAVMPRTYTAQSSLLLDTQQTDPIAEDGGARDSNATRQIMATQADLIRTPTVAGQAAAMAGLDKDPRYIAQWQEETGGRSPYADWLKARLLTSLTIEPGKDTNILVISATAGDPAEAARMANGFAKASVASQYKLRTEPAKAYASWLEKRMAEARGQVQQRQQVLSNFVRQTGLSTGEDLGSEGSQMADMAAQLATAEARAAAARQSTFSGAQSRGDVERSSTIQNIRQQVAEKNGRLAELQAVFGPDYPDVQRTRAEVATLQSQLNKELSNASSAFSAAREAEAAAERQAATASEARLRSLSAQQRARLESKGVNVAQYSTLKNEFDAAQRNYNTLNERLSRMRLQSAVPLTEVQVLDSASRFLAHSSPDPRTTLALALLLGAIIGALAAIILEYLNPRVRSWGGVERLLGVPVVGRLSLPKPAPAALPQRGNPPLLEARAG